MLPRHAAVDCGPRASPINGQVETTPSTTFTSTATYSCSNGYDLVGITERVCEADGDWSLQGSPDPVCNRTSLCVWGRVLFDWRHSHNLHALRTSKSQIWYWHKCSVQCTDLICILLPPITAVDCSQLTSPSNGLVTVSITTFLSEAMYSCSNGYILMGVVSRTCMADRNWSDAEPTCERK